MNKRLTRWSSSTALALVFLIALCLRCYYVSTAVIVGPIRGDAIQYYAYASNLANHGVFSKDAPGSVVINPDNYRDPIYPLYLGAWMKLLGTGDQWYGAVLFSQALLGALTVALATQLGRLWLPSRWALVAGLLMAVWPHNITINSYLLSETLFGFLSVVSMLLVAEACRHSSTRQAIAAGVFFGMAALTNAVLLPFGVLLAIFMRWRRLASLKICIALASSALLLPCVWAIRNASIVTSASDSSSMARAIQNLEQGSWPDFQSAWRASILGNSTAQAAARVVLQNVDAEYRLWRSSVRDGAGTMLHRMAENPIRYAAWYLLQKPQLLWSWSIEIGQGDIYVFPTVNSPFQTQPLWVGLIATCQVLNLPLMFLALASVLIVWPPRRLSNDDNPRSGQVAIICTLALVSFISAVYVALQAEPRYSIPFRPFEILLAITTLSKFTRRYLKSRGTIPNSALRLDQGSSSD